MKSCSFWSSLPTIMLKTIPNRLAKNVLTTVDCHCGGLPARILVDGVPEIPGNSAMEKRENMMRDFDYLR